MDVCDLSDSKDGLGALLERAVAHRPHGCAKSVENSTTGDGRWHCGRRGRSRRRASGSFSGPTRVPGHDPRVGQGPNREDCSRTVVSVGLDRKEQGPRRAHGEGQGPPRRGHFVRCLVCWFRLSQGRVWSGASWYLGSDEKGAWGPISLTEDRRFQAIRHRRDDL